MVSSFPSISLPIFFVIFSVTCMLAQANIVDDACKFADPDPSAGNTRPNYCRQCLNGGIPETKEKLRISVLNCASVAAEDARKKAQAKNSPKCVQAISEAYTNIISARDALAKNNDVQGADIGSGKCLRNLRICVNIAYGTPGLIPEPLNSALFKVKDLCTAGYRTF